MGPPQVGGHPKGQLYWQHLNLVTQNWVIPIRPPQGSIGGVGGVGGGGGGGGGGGVDRLKG